MTPPLVRYLARAALLLAILAPVAGSPYRSAHAAVDVAAMGAPIAGERDHVTALELAAWIRDRKPRLHVLDLRTAAEFGEYQIPGATRVPLESLAGLSFPHDDTIVLYSGGGADEAQASVLLRALGYSDVHFLRGGLTEWIDEVAAPATPTDLSRYFGGAAPRRRGC
jgi:rhodanese-related sulfurtransferase